MKLARAVFWISVSTIAYTYVGFPAMMAIRARLFPRPYKADGAHAPKVSMIVAVHDEAATIGAKLNNVAELDYPLANLQVIVVSDGSSDDTDSIVKAFELRPVTLISLPRVGKNAALNAALSAATGEILVYSDADALLAPGSLGALIAPFADTSVGGVAGDVRYVGDARLNPGERGHWLLDRLLKRLQGVSGSTTSATGQLYAIRSRHATLIPSGVPDDFYLSTGVVADGARLVFAPEAVGYQPIAPDLEAEFRRKVRVMTQGLYAVVLRRELLNPRRHGVYALQLFTHKVLRRLMVVPLVGLAWASLSLRSQASFYRIVLGMQASLYALGAAGIVLAGRPIGSSPLLSIPAYFCTANGASIAAIIGLLRGRRMDQWTTTRQPKGGT